jgi:hypothetical protein
LGILGTYLGVIEKGAVDFVQPLAGPTTVGFPTVFYYYFMFKEFFGEEIIPFVAYVFRVVYVRLQVS